MAGLRIARRGGWRWRGRSLRPRALMRRTLAVAAMVVALLAGGSVATAVSAHAQERVVGYVWAKWYVNGFDPPIGASTAECWVMAVGLDFAHGAAVCVPREAWRNTPYGGWYDGPIVGRP